MIYSDQGHVDLKVMVQNFDLDSEHLKAFGYQSWPLTQPHNKIQVNFKKKKDPHWQVVRMRLYIDAITQFEFNSCVQLKDRFQSLTLSAAQDFPLEVQIHADGI